MRTLPFLRSILFLLILLSGPGDIAAQDSVSVYFATGSSTLSQEAIARLDSLFYLERVQGVSSIYIYGYADEPGGKKINRRLSAARAAAVREHLLQSGIRPERIVEYTGKGHYSGRGEDPFERRADLMLGRRLQPPPPQQPALPRQDTVKAVKTQKVLAELRENETAVLEDITFFGGSQDVLPESIPAMELLAQFLEQNQKVHVRLEGHVCCIPDFNNLSERRPRPFTITSLRKGSIPIASVILA